MRRIFALLAALLAVHAFAARADECAQPAAVCERATPGALALIENGHPLAIAADAGDFPGVLRAARDLQGDLSAVSGTQAALSLDAPAPRTAAIIIGTLGHSARVDRIVREQGIDTSGVSGRWEGFLLQVVEHPEPGIDRALLIAGADKRGTIFGIYELSRRMGVSPWTWWADVPVPRHATLHVAPGRFTDAPVVRYRGIFINDEDPALGSWAKEKFGGTNHEFYAHVFELILRLKGNYLWPAMWVPRAFYADDPRNAALADEYGVVIGTSHHEPMMRAHAEWERYGAGPWDYTKNPDALRQFWREGITRMGGNESVVTIGMRGDGDEAMTQDTAIPLLERIVADQRGIIADVTGKPAEQTPQVWALYKEVQDYFDQGMTVPDDVTLLFSDDNWGNLRRLPKLGSTRAGGYGIYYHFDYVGGPRNYKWINSTQIERVWEQMGMAHAYGADRLWIVNVGDIKPMEFPISFFLDYAWNPDAMGPEELQAYPQKWAAQQFGDEHAQEIGEMLSLYTQFNARRKPELLSAETSQVTGFRRAGTSPLTLWNETADQTQRIGSTLDKKYHDAYYQLVEYPVLASANLNALYAAVARNRLYALQGRSSANQWADVAKALFARDAELARVYEQDIAGGKWNHMMSQPHIGYTHWQQPERNVLPALSRVDVPEHGVMGVAVEGDTRAWPQVAARAQLALIDSRWSPREVEVFNRGTLPFTVSVRTSQPWLGVSPMEGDGDDLTHLKVNDTLYLNVHVDWNKVPMGASVGQLYLRGSDSTEVYIDVPVMRKADPPTRSLSEPERGKGIAISAQNTTRKVDGDGVHWNVIRNMGGYPAAGLLALPATAPSSAPGKDSPRLEYPIWLQRDGEVDVRVMVSPSLDFRGGDGLRFGVSIGDEAPQVVTIKLDPTPGSPNFTAWEKAVVDNIAVITSRHRARAGAQTLTLWRIDPGVVFQRIEIVRDGAQQSRPDAPESAQR